MLTKIVLYAHNFFCHKFLNMNNNNNNNNGWGNGGGWGPDCNNNNNDDNNNDDDHIVDNNNNNNGWGNIGHPWPWGPWGRKPNDPRPYRGPRAFGGPQPALPVEEEEEPDLFEEPLPELRPMGWTLSPDTRQTWYWHYPRFPPLCHHLHHHPLTHGEIGVVPTIGLMRNQKWHPLLRSWHPLLTLMITRI